MQQPSKSLHLEKVSKNFEFGQESVPVLHEVDLQASPGETLAITGPSGSGKSTLLNIIGSLTPPTQGQVWLGDISISELQGKQLSEFRSQEVGFIFQEHHLLPQLTAQENILLATLNTKDAREKQQRAEQLLDALQMSHRAHFFPWQLSGGERQRVAIARAMMNHASLLLCDEPTGNLDQATSETIMSLLLEVSTSYQPIVIMVTHDLQLASKFSRKLQLEHGKLQEI